MLNYDDDFILSTAFLLMPLSLAFNSNYIFLSKSSIRVMALANMIAKSSVIILVFIAVNYSLDIGYIVIFIVVSNLVVGIYLTRLIRSRYSIRMTGFRLFEVLRFIGANKEMAISHAYVAFFGNALSFFYSGISYIHSFSIYYAYDKIITAFKILVNTTSQAVFPAIHEQTKDAFKNEVVRVFSILVVSFLLYLVSIMAGPYLFNIYLGADFINDVSLLRLMFIFIIIQPLSAYLMNVKLISKGLSKLHMRAHLIQLILFLGIMLIAKKLGEGLTLYRMLGIQLFVQSIMIIYVQMQTRVNGK
jgi:O-antigen/teichoic acid export membrane protein